VLLILEAAADPPVLTKSWASPSVLKLLKRAFGNPFVYETCNIDREVVSKRYTINRHTTVAKYE